MSYLIGSLLMVAASLACGAVMTGACLAAPNESVPWDATPPASLSPAEAQIRTAEHRGDSIQLAIGLTRRARENGDPRGHERGPLILNKNLRADPRPPDAP